MRLLAALLSLLPAIACAQSYTNFPNLQSGNVNFTATIRANGSACSSGTAIVSGVGSVTCVAVIPSSEKGANNGVATLDSGGKVPSAQLPFTGLSYEGSWNANTNSPTLADGVGTGGDFYITSVAGTQDLGSGNITFAVGDWALYNGTIWQKVPSSAAVSSVFGRTGAVVATSGDYTATQVTNTPAGGISATTAQAAINELDTEKQAAASTLTSWAALTRASGFDTFTQTPSSANLRGLLTDETGTGLAYFQGGALGTPASGTLTSATGLPWSTGLTGVPTTAVGYGITGGAKLDAYAGGDTPSAFTLGIVDSVDAATWRSAIGAGTATITPAALTKTDDTNVTLTLGGTPATSLLQAASITAGWTGTLAVPRGGIGVGTLTGLALGNGTSAFSAYAGTSCTNQFPRSLNASGAATCASVNLASDVTGTISDGSLSSNVPLKNASNTFSLQQVIANTSEGEQLRLVHDNAILNFYDSTNTTRDGYLWMRNSGDSQLWVQTNNGLAFGTNNSSRGGISSAGNWSISAPSSGSALDISTPSGGSTTLQLSAVAGRSPRITFAQAGQTSWINYQGGSSNALAWYDGTADRMTLAGGLQIGAPSGSDKGSGTLNTAGTIYQNNAPVALADGSNLTALPAISGSSLTGLLKPGNNLSDVSSASTSRTNLGVTATGSDTTYAYRANNLSDLASASTARTNLGLAAVAASGSATDLSTGTLNNSRLPATIDVATDAKVGGVSLCRSNGTNCPNYPTSGTWSPTITLTNGTGASTYRALYQRVGNVVTGAFTVAWSTVSAATTGAAITLPISSDFTSSYDVSGTCNIFSSVGASTAWGRLLSDYTNDRFSVSFPYFFAAPADLELQCSYSYIVM